MAYPNCVLKGETLSIRDRGKVLCFGFPKHVVIERSDETMSKENAKYRKNGAIYLYVGHSGSKNSPDDVYVGKTKNDWWERIHKPHGDEDTEKGKKMRWWWNNCWEYTFLFTPKDEDFKWSKSQLSYLESAFFFGACNAHKCNVVNDIDTPSGRSWSEIETALDWFVDDAGVWMCKYGFRLF